MSAAEILVIILAAALAVFLVLSIVLAVLLIRVTIQIKKLTDTAKAAVDNVSNASLKASKLMSPAVLLKMLSGKGRRGKKSRRDDDEDEY